MRCVYCRPAAYTGDVDGLLSPAEIETFVGHLVRTHGLKKVRLTGGEPTTRPDLLDIVRRLHSALGLSGLAMTTNGLTLARDAAALVDAGLSRVNVSLDSLDVERFRSITGVDGLRRVLAGIDAARKAGLSPVKLNTVVVRGENDAELGDLVKFAASEGLEIRFIELMPMGPLAGEWQRRFVSENEMRESMCDTVLSWEPLSYEGGAARRYRARLGNHVATVGFITAMSCNFCAHCDRIRIAADGSYYPCLMDVPAGNLLRALRPAFDPAGFDRILAEGLRCKAAEHPATGAAVMTALGG
jgi:cyclic pyranopterin phosphate synthase